MHPDSCPSFWERRQEAAAAETCARLQPIRTTGIPLLGGRPERETVICKDDILNLRIALGTAKDYDAFVAMV